MIIKTLSRQHINKKISDQQDQEIRQISHKKRIPYLAAKEEYFRKRLLKWI